MRARVAVMVVASGLLLAGAANAQSAGEKVYDAQKCSMCHSVAGKGNKKLPLDGVGAKLSDADIKLWLTDPKAAAAKFKSEAKPPMKSYATLPAADIDALVAYVKTLK